MRKRLPPSTSRRRLRLGAGLAFGACLCSSSAFGEGGPAYALRLEVDLPVLGFAAAGAVIPLVRNETTPPWCAPVCDPSHVNAFDRPVAGVYRTGWSRVSDIAVASLIATDVIALVADEGLLAGLNDAVVVAEAVLAAQAFASLTSSAVRRPRPYMYGESAPADQRTDPYGALSFFSGHTTTAFAAAVALHRTLARRHPDSSVPNIVLGATLAGAALVGTGRVLSGNHFPTDVLVGAVVGTSSGVLVPALHGSGLALAPFSTAGAHGLCLQGGF